MRTVTYRGVELTNVGLSWYVDYSEMGETAAVRHVGTSLAAAKRWVRATEERRLALEVGCES